MQLSEKWKFKASDYEPTFDIFLKKIYIVILRYLIW